MNKSLWYSLTLGLVATLLLLTGGHPAFSAKNDGYGGVAKFAERRAFVNFGYPPTIEAVDQIPAADALQTLIKRNVDGEYEAQLATSWEYSADGTVLTLKLRENVTFHDDTPFNAEAVKWNLDLWLKAPGSVLSDLESVDVVDDLTVQLNFARYNALTLFDLAAEAFIASPTAIEKNGEDWAKTHPVGTGPFKLKKYVRNQKLTYEKNENFWQEGRPFLDGVEYHIIKDPMTQISALKSKMIDGINTISMQTAESLIKDGYKITHYDGISHAIYGDSNNPDSPWSNRKFREAIEYAIDKETIMKELGYGYPKTIYQPVSSDNRFYNPDLEPRTYNPEKAKQLLAEAGYGDGVSTTLYHFKGMWPAAVSAIQSDLAKVGITIKTPIIDRPKFLKYRFNGGLNNEGCFLVLPFFVDYLYTLNNLMLSTVKHAPDMARPDGLDDVIKKAIATPDEAEQKQLIMKASKLIYDDVTFIPFNLEARLMATSEAMTGIDEFHQYSPRADRFTNAQKIKK